MAIGAEFVAAVGTMLRAAARIEDSGVEVEFTLKTDGRVRVRIRDLTGGGVPDIRKTFAHPQDAAAFFIEATDGRD